MFKHNKFAIIMLTAALGAGVLMTAPSAHARSTFISTWDGLYPDSNSLNNATTLGCQLCHATATGAGRNAYGADLDTALASLALSDALISIEGLDSDSDPTSSSNLLEIDADTQPGWAEGDNPPGVSGDLDPVTPVADISVSPLSVDFGAVTVGTSGTDSVAISNVGSADLTVNGLNLSGSSEFSLPGAPPPPFTVAPSTSVNVSVEYAPVNDGLDNATLNIVSDSPGEESISVALAGTGVPVVVNECVPDIDPASLVFGSIELGNTLTLVATVTNNGTLECAVEATVSGSDEFSLASGTMFTVAPGDSVDVSVDYAPVDLGDDSGKLTLAFPDRSIDVPLSGSGIETADTDGDGVPDSSDNCTSVSNPSQLDTDGDGYGNLCDGDLNNDGSTDTLDLNLYKLAHRSAVGDANYDIDADFNGDGVINTLDLNIYKGLHRLPPGPSCCAP